MMLSQLDLKENVRYLKKQIDSVHKKKQERAQSIALNQSFTSVQLDKSMRSDGELEFTTYVPFKGFETITTFEFFNQIASLKKQQKVNLMKSNFRLKLIGPSEINTNGLSSEQIKFIHEALSE